jgi:hypothetical protein
MYAPKYLNFKLELDPRIRKLPVFNAPFGPHLQNDHYFEHESNCETSKNESFADDSTTLTYFELKNNLEEFSKLSGLKCNFDKIVIVRIGDTDSLPDPRINELGFSIENECKLLGFTVGQGDCMYEKNFEDML